MMSKKYRSLHWLITATAIVLPVLVVGGAHADLSDELTYEDFVALRDANLITDAMPALREHVDRPDCDPRLIRLLAETLMMSDQPTEALSLFQRAADAGDSDSLYQVGVMYEVGQGVPASAELAFLWFERAAKADHVAGAVRYSEAALANPSIIPKLETDPLERLAFAGENGSPRANYLLGTLHEQGLHVVQDDVKAAHHYRMAVDSEPKAMTRLAAMLLNGSVRAAGVESPHALLEAASAAGDAGASAYLGRMLEYGVGAERNLKLALEHYRIAAAHGVEWAEEGRDRLEERKRSLSLFGLRVYGVQRDELRDRLARLDIDRIEHDGPSYFDFYNADELVTGAETMTIAYAPGRGNHVAEIAYRFTRDSMNEAKVSTRGLVERLEQKYGSHERIRGAGRSQGFQWVVGRTQVTLSRSREDRSVSITYQFRPYADELRALIAESQRRQSESGNAVGDTL